MSDKQPRLRMFAGPNGSGKTTIKNELGWPPKWFGIYINPDDLEKIIRETGQLPLAPFGISVNTDEIRSFFLLSKFLQSHQLHTAGSKIEVLGDAIGFRNIEMNSYYASVLADFLRRKALELSRSFSFETVMSSPDKVDLLKTAQSHGFRTYLYFVATEGPDINIDRIKSRVADGGHDVPIEKVRSRYYRSLKLVREAIRYCDRAFFFDTSKEESWYFAEVKGGTNLELKSDEMPNWFQPIWDQF